MHPIPSPAWLVLASLTLATVTARAESLRCNGQIAAPGETKVSVLMKCGEPMLRDTFCRPFEVVVPAAPYPVGPYPVTPYPRSPYPVTRATAACEMVDDWVYDRGEGNLIATVRFARGAVETIRYEGRPR